MGATLGCIDGCVELAEGNIGAPQQSQCLSQQKALAVRKKQLTVIPF